MTFAPYPALPTDSILGVAPERVYWPVTVRDCAEVLGHERGRVAFIGGGTELGLGRAPAWLEAVVRTGRMARIIDYAPADMVVVAEAGVTVGQLQAVAAAERQMLALDPPQADRATLGGLVSTSGFGPRRARYGAIRDLIIGVTLVRADGVVARGGGKVVKNVAGFDLPKVMCGSLGTLGMVVEATFRLHPLPETGATVLYGEISAEKVVEVIGALRQRQLEPTSAVALRSGSLYDLGVRFEGFEHGVRQQTQRAVELGGGLETPCEALADDAGFWQRHDRARTDGGLRVKLTALPSQLPALESPVTSLLGGLRDPSFAWYATLGIGFASGDVRDAGAAIEVAAARTAIVKLGGALVVEAAPSDLRDIDPWGPQPAAFPLMAALKQRFDPERRLNPGRFVGGL
jgi:glycolate oxidase FAD binding subunit